MRLAELLPRAFGPADLSVAGGLLASPSRGLIPDGKVDAGLLAMAEASYAPYTQAHAAVALTTHDGETVVGPYLENAAFNPSVSPTNAAAVALALADRGLGEVVEAVVLQVHGSVVDHASATRLLLEREAPAAVIRVVTMNPKSESTTMSTTADRSFYFFDFDDNIMFLPTPVLVRNRATHRTKKLTTAAFAGIRGLLGQPGKWKEFELFDGTYAYFRDIPDDQRKPGGLQHFVTDITTAIAGPPETWQAPSWPLFVYACENKRPVAIITARGHSPETLRAGIRVLVEKKLLPREPDFLYLAAVGNTGVAEELLVAVPAADRAAISALPDRTSALKRIAIRVAVDTALAKYGAEYPHRFGMSDDDPQNVDLIIKAMCDCKTKYRDKRFFVINTHHGEWVKLEVFEHDHPVTGRAAQGEVVA